MNMHTILHMCVCLCVCLCVCFPCVSKAPGTIFWIFVRFADNVATVVMCFFCDNICLHTWPIFNRLLLHLRPPISIFYVIIFHRIRYGVKTPSFMSGYVHMLARTFAEDADRWPLSNFFAQCSSDSLRFRCIGCLKKSILYFLATPIWETFCL